MTIIDGNLKLSSKYYQSMVMVCSDEDEEDIKNQRKLKNQ